MNAATTTTNGTMGSGNVVMASSVPAVSWAAVFAGAAVAAAMSLALLVLGTGLGLTAVSPWASESASAKTMGMGAIVWLVVMQLASAALGGYIAGRLRTKWSDAPADEVYFRDTAHGFLVWAVATVVTAGFLSSAVGTVVAGVGKAGATVAAAGAGGMAAMGAGAAAAGKPSGGDGTSGDGMARYYTDMLFRAAKPAAGADDTAVRGEAGRIVSNALQHGELAPADRTYLAQTISARTGLSQADAEKRVSDTVAQAQRKIAEAKEKAQVAAEEARKAGVKLALWMFVSLLAGAFCGSYAGTIGGRQRDLA